MKLKMDSVEKVKIKSCSLKRSVELIKSLTRITNKREGTNYNQK